MAATIRDLAEQLGLSKSTVSYALNGGPKPVSESVRLRVQAAAAEMGFRRNEVARSLAVGRTHTIGFVPSSIRLRTLRSWFERTALEAICVAADERGLHLLLPCLRPAPEGEEGGPHFATRVDGVVLLAPLPGSALPARLQALDVPMAIVASGGSEVGLRFDADNVTGASAAADHLVALGHRRIAIVTHLGHGDIEVRQRAFIDRLRSHGIDVPPAYVETTDLVAEGGRQAGHRLLTVPNPPTAVFCVNDPTALGLLSAARELGIRVPEDLSVVGFDDDEVAANAWPPLTTFRQPVAEMAVAAFESVLDQIAGRESNGRLFSTPLIVRATTGPPTDAPRNA